MIESRHTPEIWILAFDSSCDTCSAVSAVVAQASDGKLEVLPLTHPQVKELRRQSSPSPLKWAPTLLHARENDVRAWTGPGMSWTLIKRLGPRSSLEVLRALGKLREEVGHNSSGAAVAGIGRKRFLHLAGGAIAAVGLTMGSQNPAFAKASENSKAGAWVQANMSRLPRTYDEIIRHAIPYRRAIYQELSPQERSQAWLEHFKSFRAARPGLSASQGKIIQELTELTPRVFASPGRHTGELRSLAESARRAFGLEEAAALLTRLGPDDGLTVRRATCRCSMEDAHWCGFYNCAPINCTPTSGCGDLWNEVCNGICAP
ncbi:bacteriocin fulvocin C-related protein [Streptomyces decoyicus]|uniref:bacteriocin fulvocin C-related protein n=1 Tax=Streptomyces decoyicus TaxID=249567 RepID=UPI0033A4411A